jgi:hypothetical protein
VASPKGKCTHRPHPGGLKSKLSKLSYEKK